MCGKFALRHVTARLLREKNVPSNSLPYCPHRPVQGVIANCTVYCRIAAFAYDEFGEFQDAGALFYQTDFWSLWDLGIIGTGVAFLVARVIGLAKDSDMTIDISFDILSLEALFLVPR